MIDWQFIIDNCINFEHILVLVLIYCLIINSVCCLNHCINKCIFIGIWGSGWQYFTFYEWLYVAVSSLYYFASCSLWLCTIGISFCWHSCLSFNRKTDLSKCKVPYFLSAKFISKLEGVDGLGVKKKKWRGGGGGCSLKLSLIQVKFIMLISHFWIIKGSDFPPQTMKY